jgi:hypothetical protein
VANWLARIFGSRNQRLVGQYAGVVKKTNAFEAGLQGLSDADLAAKTTQFREQLAAGKTLDDVLPEAFAVVREASRRTLGLRHFDVQLIGGMALHQGKIAEMRTGEGKTLVAVLPAYLNALSGNGVHVVTVNDYLARRDSECVGQVRAPTRGSWACAGRASAGGACAPPAARSATRAAAGRWWCSRRTKPCQTRQAGRHRPAAMHACSTDAPLPASS